MSESTTPNTDPVDAIVQVATDFAFKAAAPIVARKLHEAGLSEEVAKTKGDKLVNNFFDLVESIVDVVTDLKVANKK